MKIGVIVCDPGDRPDFFGQYVKYINYQTMPADVVTLRNEPKTEACDLTRRMREGCAYLENRCDLIIVVENDDWYSKDYFARMAILWDKNGRPDLIGLSETIYYHLQTKRYARIPHPRRSSLFTTCISASAVAKIKWPTDDTAFLDLALWRQLRGVSVHVSDVLAIGIKHGQGGIVSQGHNGSMAAYKTRGVADSDFRFLRDHAGPDFPFYEKIHNKLARAVC